MKSLVELNIDARASSRRKQMRAYRAQKVMIFGSKEDFSIFLDSFNWHKRPWKLVHESPNIYGIEWLDWKPKKVYSL